MVTARALADLKALLGYIQLWLAVKPDLECLFLKGANVGVEIEEAQHLYSFDCEQIISTTDSRCPDPSS